jgi:hypothetical protein
MVAGDNLASSQRQPPDGFLDGRGIATPFDTNDAALAISARVDDFIPLRLTVTGARMKLLNGDDEFDWVAPPPFHVVTAW